MADPRLFIGLNERDSIYNNKDFLWLPLAVQFWVNEMIRVSARTTLGGPLDGFSDAYFGSLGLFGAFRITDMIEAFAAFDFTNLYGKGNSGDYRTLVLGANFDF